MLNLNNVLMAATLIFGIAVSQSPAQATASGTPAKPVTQSDNVKPSDWLGLPVMSVDGRLIGLVTEYKASAATGSPVLIIRSQYEGQSFAVPAGLATHSGRSVQLHADATQIGARG